MELLHIFHEVWIHGGGDGVRQAAGSCFGAVGEVDMENLFVLDKSKILNLDLLCPSCPEKTKIYQADCYYGLEVVVIIGVETVLGGSRNLLINQDF